MRSRYSTPGLLMLLTGIVALMSFGVELARKERALLRTQYQVLFYGRLSDLRGTLADRLLSLAHSALQNARSQHELEGGYADPYPFFVFQGGEATIFPGSGKVAGELAAELRDLTPTTGSLLRRGHPIAPVSETRNAYWIPWKTDDHSHFLFVETQGPTVYGLDFRPSDIEALAVSSLPEVDPADYAAKYMQFRIERRGGETVHRWGRLLPGEYMEPLTSVDLAGALKGYKLSCLAKVGLWDIAFYRSAFFTILPGVCLAMATLVVLSVFFYREHTRGIREATERVTFVNQVSHELKTPLTNIRMYAELLENELSDDDTSQRYLKIIGAESRRLTRLIHNILTFSSHERGMLRIHPKPARIRTLIETVATQFTPSLQTRGLTLRLFCDTEATVVIDADAAQQILGNLLSNAEKYAAQGKFVDVEATLVDGLTTLRVRDYGPGIAPSLGNRVFEPFYRGASNSVDGIPGAGIGLSIARDLARMHGGDVAHEHPAEGGSCFVATLRTPMAVTQGGEHADTAC